MDQPPKFVQIAIGSKSIFALDSDGVIWDIGNHIFQKRLARSQQPKGDTPDGEPLEVARRADCEVTK